MSNLPPMTRRTFPAFPPGNTNALRLARRRHNLTQQLLADFTQLGLSTIERAERGLPLRLDSCRRLCDYFGMSAEELGLLHSDGQQQGGEPPGGEAAPAPRCSIIVLADWRKAHAG